MVPTYQDAGTAAGGIGLSLSPTLPAVIDAGDLIVVACCGDQNFGVTTPPGYSDGDFMQIGGGAMTAKWFWKWADGSEGGTTVTVERPSGTSGWIAVPFTFRGGAGNGDPWNMDGVNPVKAETSWSADSTPTTSALTTTEDDCLVAALFCEDDNVAMAAVSNYTARNEQSSTAGTDIAVGLYTQDKATAGAVAAEAMNAIVSAENWVVFTFSIRPGAGGGGVAPGLPFGSRRRGEGASTDGRIR